MFAFSTLIRTDIPSPKDDILSWFFYKSKIMSNPIVVHNIIPVTYKLNSKQFYYDYRKIRFHFLLLNIYLHTKMSTCVGLLQQST